MSLKREAGQVAPDFLNGGGEMGALMRAKNWADTPLGPPETWPQSLKTVVRILLSSRYQMWMGWGDQLSFFYNDAYSPTLGVKHGHALGQAAQEVWKEIWPDIGPRIEHVLKTGVATWDEGLLLFLERSGYPEETYHTFSYSPLADDDGRTVGMLCVVTEETERVIGERRIATLRDLAAAISSTRTQAEIVAATERQLGENLKDLPFTLVYLFDEGGVAKLACAAGVSGAHEIAPLIIDPSEDEPIWPIEEIAQSQAAFTIRDLDRRFEQVPAGDWDQPPREVVVTPIARQGQDNPAGFIVAGVNPYRRLDEAYLGFINLVAGQFASGLANVRAYEEQRQRAEALAEIDRAKTTFFSNVSHEFRTPLTLMLGPLEDLLNRPGAGIQADERGLVQLAHRSGVRLLKLVNTLLDFTRIEAGRVQASFEPVDISGFTAELASNFRSTVERAGLRLVVDCPALPEPIYVDRDMWEKIVLNLISNAFKFTFEGEIAVAVRSSSDGSHAEVTIRDTGTGIPPDDVPHLFERFRRVEGVRGRSIEGSGIGLALVQELVKLHGGTIAVASRVGKGSTFTVSVPFGSAHLPADRIGQGRQGATGVRSQAYINEAAGWLGAPGVDASELPTPSASEDIGDGGETTGRRSERILLVDDNADMRNYVQRLLSARYTVDAVNDGQEALETARRQRPDLVLSDVMMPRLDGFGLLRALRDDKELRDVPVILLSARAGEEASVEGLKAGADDYLTKPFSARELLARVGANLEMATLRREALRIENELRRQAELAQERAEGILSSINDGFLALDRSWQFTYVNAAAERMLGRRAVDLKGKNYWQEFPHTMGTAVETHLHSAMADRTRVGYESFYKPWQRWFQVSVYPAADGGLSIYFLDATERKAAEARLRELNETLERRVSEALAERKLLADIVEGTDAFVQVADLDYRWLAINKAAAREFERIFGQRPRPGDNMLELLADRPVHAAAVKAVWSRALAGEEFTQIDEFGDPNIDRRWYEMKFNVLRDQNGRQIGAYQFVYDVTDRLRDQARLAEAEEALRQAQKMESIGQLTGGVAHDFNNLLTVIIGNLETLQRQLGRPAPDLSNMARWTDGAMRGAQRAASLTQRLLAFSRQQPLDPKPVDIGRLVTGMSDLLHRTLGEKIAVETVLAGGLWRASIDANQLEIAIINLAVNARDAMPEGGKLTIETANTMLDEGYAPGHAEVVPGQYVMVAVTDSGSGMSPETLAKAFDPFFTTKDIGHGTGLGLSQVYGFVKQSGGHVKIYSELGEGTTVKMYLPRLHSNEMAETDEQVEIIANAHDGETILMVEDDDDVRAHTHGILRELGYTVLEAANGSDALDILRKHPEVQLVFTDVGLPGGMNGRQLADAARRERPRLKVLFTTGYARNAIVHDGRLDAGVQLIVKPFTYPALASKIRDVLDASTAPARILVVEDEVLIQMMLAQKLEDLGFKVEVAGSAADAKSRLRILGGEVDAAIVDIGLPDAKGDSFVGELRSIYPKMPIVIASGQYEEPLRKRFEGEKTIGFLPKPYTTDQLKSVLQTIGALRA